MAAQEHHAGGMIEADCGLLSSSDSALSDPLSTDLRALRVLAIFILAAKPPRCRKNVT